MSLPRLPEKGHGQPIQTVAKQAEDRGEESQCRDHGYHDHEDRAYADRDEYVERNHQHSEQRQYDCDSTEQYGTRGRIAGPFDGVDLLEALLELLTVSGDDEQRIVDADRQADHEDDVGHEER